MFCIRLTFGMFFFLRTRALLWPTTRRWERERGRVISGRRVFAGLDHPTCPVSCEDPRIVVQGSHLVQPEHPGPGWSWFF